MIAIYPASVFESMGAMEKDLYYASVPLIETFSKMCSLMEASESKSFRDIHSQVTPECFLC